MELFKLRKDYLNEKGFTLLEILLAVAIMVSVASALMHVLNQCSNLTQTARFQDIALNAAQVKMEEIASSDLSKIMDYNSHNFAVVDRQANSLLIPPAGQVYPGNVTVSPVPLTTDLFNVTITVSWQQMLGRVISRTLRNTFVVKE